MSYKRLQEEEFEDHEAMRPEKGVADKQDAPIDGSMGNSHLPSTTFDPGEEEEEEQGSDSLDTKLLDEKDEDLPHSHDYDSEQEQVEFIQDDKIAVRKETKTYKYLRRVLGVGAFVMLLAFLATAITLIAVSPPCSDQTVEELPWWKTTIIYQCYPRSFQDSDGDGNGDLNGIRSRIDYFVDIGIGTVWLNPIFTSPQMDNGYDIANYTDIDPLYGTLEDFEALLSELQDKGIHLLLDFVPNHTSDQHPWFLESRSSRTNSTKRDWYVWADGNENGEPPNNWISVFGGSAWTYDNSTGQYYLHQFSKFQPDLNYHNPEVISAMEDVLKFWLSMGVDGFRIDAVKFLLEDPELRDEPINPDLNTDGYDSLIHNFTTDYPGIHNITRSWRRILDSYSNDNHSRERFMVGEVYDPVETVMLYYGKNDSEFHFPFNFFLLENTNWTGTAVSQTVANWLTNMPEGAWPNWVLGNHDNSRIASKAETYLARALNVLLLTLPGTPTTYYGEEILMTDVDVPHNKSHDLNHQDRDKERTPMQWNISTNAGFTSNSTPWLPVPENYRLYNVDVEMESNSTMLALYQMLIELRSNNTAFKYTDYESIQQSTPIYAFRRYHGSSSDQFLIVVNFSQQPTTAKFDAIFSEPQIVLSSNLNRTGTVDLASVDLAQGEALVIKGVLNTCV